MSRKLREAGADVVAHLQASGAPPAIVREASVWSEREAHEVEAVRAQLNLLVGERNWALRDDLVLRGERASDAVARLQGRQIERRHVEAPKGGVWSSQRGEATRLAALGVTLEAQNYESMAHELARREAADQAALADARKERAHGHAPHD